MALLHSPQGEEEDDSSNEAEQGNGTPNVGYHLEGKGGSDLLGQIDIDTYSTASPRDWNTMI